MVIASDHATGALDCCCCSCSRGWRLVWGYALQPNGSSSACSVLFPQLGQFEEFIAHIAAGARWKVLSVAAFVALTGIGLLLMPSAEQTSTLLNACFVAKSVLFVITVSLFCFTSWRLWPARTLASAEEIPKFQQTFRRIAVALLVLVGLNIVLGVLSSH